MQDEQAVRIDAVLPSYLCSVIPYEKFTRMQSESLETWFSDQNMLISAPTGAGKTVCFELCILRLLHQVVKCSDKGKVGVSGLGCAVLYLTPTKCICNERAEEWAKKFSPFGLRVHALTGDTPIDSANNSKLDMADIILATAEKWDAVTRDSDLFGGHDITSRVSLLLIDEVHHVGDSRGLTLELVVTRLLTISNEAAVRHASSGHWAPISKMRTVAASATMRNVDDIASWLRVRTHGLQCFGEEYRPVPLDFVVKGYYASNAWQIGKVLERNLLSVIETYSGGKPSIVFCTSRNQTITAARALVKQLNEHTNGGLRKIKLTNYMSKDEQNRLIQCAQNCNDVILREVLPDSVGVHNADMAAESRELVENLFKEGIIQCLFSTSTLAQGVNLPARLVVIYGTTTYHDGKLCEYETNIVLQMCGRAGRSGLDERGVAVIMTANTNTARYEHIHERLSPIESQMDGRIEECMNVEIARQSVRDVVSAMTYLSNSFYWNRLKSVEVDKAKSAGETDQQRAMNLAMRTLAELNRAGMITFDGDNFGVSCTKLGVCMARYNISYKSAQMLVRQLGHVGNPSGVLKLVSSLDEVMDGVFIRRLEKKTLNELNEHVRIPVGGKVKTRDEKVSVLIQAWMMTTSHAILVKDYSLCREAERILMTAGRVCQAMIEWTLELGTDMSYESVIAVLQVCRGISCKRMWDKISINCGLYEVSESVVRNLMRNGQKSIIDIGRLTTQEVCNIGRCSTEIGEKISRKVKTLPVFSLHCDVIRMHGEVGRVVSIAVEVRIIGVAKWMKVWSERHGFVVIGSQSCGVLYVGKFMMKDKCYKVVCDIDKEFSNHVHSKTDKWIDVTVGCDSIMGLDVCERVVHDARAHSHTETGISLEHSLKNRVERGAVLMAFGQDRNVRKRPQNCIGNEGVELKNRVSKLRKTGRMTKLGLEADKSPSSDETKGGDVLTDGNDKIRKGWRTFGGTSIEKAQTTDSTNDTEQDKTVARKTLELEAYDNVFRSLF